MEGMRQNGERRHLVIGHLAPGRVRIDVELALHPQASLGGGCRNQLEDHRIADERLAAPVLADEGKEAMLNLVPFARARRKVADRDRQVPSHRPTVAVPISTSAPANRCCPRHRQ